MNQELFELELNRKCTEKFKISNFFTNCKVDRFASRFCNGLLSLIPILKWLPNYNWRDDLTGDIIGGLTIGIMHVPQGMAYATLAGLPPVIGMYTSFFTSTFYMFFGTSRHISIGVFAVASLMVGTVRMRLLPPDDVQLEDVNGTLVEYLVPVKGPIDFGFDVDPTMLTSTLAMSAGIFQLCMGILRLSFITTYMSDSLVSGFTTGSAFHVLIAQLNKVFGVKLPRYSGSGMLLFMLRDLFLSLPKANYITIAISACSITFLVFGREYLNPQFRKISPVPLPLELILVIIGTTISWKLDLKENYHLKIVDYVPQGLPVPSLPRFRLIPYLLSDAIGLAIICYIFVISMAKLFAKRGKYKIDPNQELFAVGFMSVLSSFFPVYPAGASLSRSSVCEQSGAKTQLNTVFSSSLLIIVIVWLGPFLEPLPMCILACIVMVSLKGLFMQFSQLPGLFRMSKYDFSIWIVSCFSTVTFDVMTGLFVSIAFALFTIALREQWPKNYLLGKVPNRDTYKPEMFYNKLQNVDDNIKIVRFESPLHFINVSQFRELFDEIFKGKFTTPMTCKDLQKVIVQSDDKVGSMISLEKNDQQIVDLNSQSLLDENNQARKGQRIILDCSAIVHIDTMGIEAFKEIHSSASEHGHELRFADAPENLLNALEKASFFSIVPKAHFYPIIQCAVESNPP